MAIILLLYNILMHKILKVIHATISVTFVEKPYTYLTYRINS